MTTATTARITGALTLVLLGAPRTKKNHGRVLQRGKRKVHVQSEAHEAWNASAQMQLAKFRASTDWTLPIKSPVNCRALFFRDAERGDFIGYAQALADALQEGGIVENDSQIRSWDGSRLLVEKANPRIIVSLEATA